MSSYFGKNVTNVVKGVSVENVASEDAGVWRPEKK
jgi:hypothetical protein